MEGVSMPRSLAARLRQQLRSSELTILMEAHNGLSAKLAAEAGFEAIWGSGLSIAASLGVRDNNEASWTQVLEVVEFMVDASNLPILLDGDTGYGNFNNVRRLVGGPPLRACHQRYPHDRVSRRRVWAERIPRYSSWARLCAHAAEILAVQRRRI
jgi:hypothetical protein